MRLAPEIGQKDKIVQNQQVELGQEREAARMLGKTRYFTGRPCIHGHVAERYTSSGNCIECLRVTHDRNKSLQAKIDHALMQGQLSKEQAIALGSPWYCHGWGLPACGHLSWQRVVDDRCKMCIDEEDKLALDLLS